MPRIKFIVAYDGTDFCGWQRQNHGAKKSVAHVIQDAIEKILGEKVSLFASGRTDAGVHALNQVCHVDVQKNIEPNSNWDFCWAVNAQLPSSIVLKKAWIAPTEFHSTLSSTHKTYKYWLLNQVRPSPFLDRFAYWVRKPIDINHLNESAKYLIGKQDFKSMQSVGTPVPHTVRTIYSAEWITKKGNLLEFKVTGSGFLKQMVRNIVGTQLMLERKGLSPETMKEILAAKDRKIAGPPAPPQGLYLLKVYYPQALDNECIEL